MKMAFDESEGFLFLGGDPVHDDDHYLPRAVHLFWKKGTIAFCKSARQPNLSFNQKIRR